MAKTMHRRLAAVAEVAGTDPSRELLTGIYYQGVTVMEKNTDKFHASVVAFLRMAGWIPLVMGNISIEACPPFKYNFRLIIDFTGTKKFVRRGKRVKR